jgi:DNA-binding SARP family transcriptional activator
MPDLKILLLGPPEVRWRGQWMTVQRRIPRVLLYYLASKGRLVGRETLLTLFWEDSFESEARRRLREVISRLRAELPLPEVILSRNDLIGLDLKQVYIDQLEFQNLVNQVGRLPWRIPTYQPLPEDVHHDLTRAIHLWRGGNFLEGANLPSSSGLDEWLVRTNQHLTHLRNRILERLSNHAEAIGDLEQALTFTRLALENDHYNEELHIRVIQLLLEMNSLTEARDHFSLVKRILHRQLEISTNVKLQALSKQIQPGQKLVTAPSQVEWRIWPSVQAPFVGRQKPMDQMRRALHN